MISTIEAGRKFLVEANEPYLIEVDLNTAVDAARRHAMQEGRNGILVTRHGHTTFTVAVSAKVPYGQTMEEERTGWESLESAKHQILSRLAGPHRWLSRLT